MTRGTDGGSIKQTSSQVEGEEKTYGLAIEKAFRLTEGANNPWQGRIPKPTRLQLQEDSRNKLPAPTMYLDLSIHLLGSKSHTSIGQRKETPCSPGGSLARGGASNHRCDGWTSRRKLSPYRQDSYPWVLTTSVGREDYPRQISDKEIHEAIPQLSHRSTYCCHLEAPSPHLPRMPIRLAR